MCMTVMLTKNWKSLCAILSLFLCQFKKLFEFIPLGILIQVSCMHEAIFEQLSTVCWLIFGLCYQYNTLSLLTFTFLSFFNSMERILERYERYSYAERQLVASDQPQTVGYQLL